MVLTFFSPFRKATCRILHQQTSHDQPMLIGRLLMKYLKCPTTQIHCQIQLGLFGEMCHILITQSVFQQSKIMKESFWRIMSLPSRRCGPQAATALLKLNSERKPDPVSSQNVQNISCGQLPLNYLSLNSTHQLLLPLPGVLRQHFINSEIKTFIT